MIYKVEIDSVDVTSLVDIGFAVHEKLDESLDSGLLTITHTTKEDNYFMWKSVDIYIDEVKKFEFKIGGDEVTLISKSPLLYEHRLSLVEPIKILESFMISGYTLTQPLNTVEPRKTLYDALEFLKYNALLNGAIDIDISGLETLLEQYESPEFTFKDITFREALNNILGVLEGIARLDNSNVLSIQFFNEIKEFINYNSDIIFKTKQQDITFYGQSADLDALNLVDDNEFDANVEIYPSENQFITHRSQGVGLWETDSMVIPTPKPIYEIVELLWKGEIAGVEKTVDLTSRVREINKWRELQTDVEDETQLLKRYIPTNEYQINTIYYEYAKKDIVDNFTGGLFGTSSAIENAICCAYNIDAGSAIQPSNIDTEKVDYLFLIKYKPIIPNAKFQIKKTDITEHDTKTFLYSNQQNRILNMDRVLSNIGGKIERLGNSQISIKHRVTDLLDLYSIGDFTDENYIITERELIFFNDYIFANYNLDKNFNRISQFIGVNSELRQWEVGEKDRTLQRNLVLKNFCEIDIVESGTKNGLNNTVSLGNRVQMLPDATESYMKTLDNSSTVKINNTVLSPKNASAQLYFDTESYSVSYNGGAISIKYTSFGTACNGGGSLISAIATPISNSAGERMKPMYRESDLTPILNKAGIEFSRYASSTGEAILYDIFFVDEYNNPTDLDDEILRANLIPNIADSVITGKLLQTSNLQVYKDRRSILNIMWQLQSIPFDKRQVIIGELFNKVNGLISDYNLGTLRFVSSRESSLGINDTKKIPSDYVKYLDGSPLLSPTITYDIANYKAVVSHPDLSTLTTSWAITDINDNILIGVNQDGVIKSDITFRFSS